MVDHSKPLTPKQQTFAAEHHEVVYDFLREYRLPEADYYDVVVFGYINAVRKYDELPALHEWKFKTIAFYSMRSSLSNDSKKAKRRLPSPLSLDAEDENGLTLYDAIPAPEEAPGTDGQIVAQYADLLKAATKKQLDLLTMMACGYSASEVAAMTGAKAKAVESAVRRGRERIRKAEQARSDQLKQKVDARLGWITPSDAFTEAETLARRRLAIYKTTHPTYYRKESALVRIVAEIMQEKQPEPVCCGGGTDYSLFLKGGEAHEQKRPDHHHECRAA